MYNLNVDYIETNEPNKVRVSCPFCVSKGKDEDTKFKLYANFSLGVFICFRCGEKGRIEKLMELIGGSVDSLPVPNDEQFEKLKNRLSNMFKIKDKKKLNLDEMSYPLNDDTPIALNYMIEKRGFSRGEIDYYKLRVGKRYHDSDGKKISRWAGRIIFPFFYKGEVVFLVGRSYTGKEPKYLNSEGDKTEVLYGVDGIIGEECLLCEGIISSIAAQRKLNIPAVSCLGKTITDFQLSKLREKCSIVTVCLDGDVSKIERERFNFHLLGFGFIVYEMILPDGYDPDEMTKSGLINCYKNRNKII